MFGKVRPIDVEFPESRQKTLPDCVLHELSRSFALYLQGGKV